MLGRAIILIVLITGCGSYEPGTTDKTIDCIDGCNYDTDDYRAEDGEDGERGPQGPRGEQGPPGNSGSSCSLLEVENGAIITCDTNSILILNGTDGKDREDSKSSSYIFTEMYDPCGPEARFDEVLFKTKGGEYIAHYSHGNKQFLTVVPPGNYTTTDGTRCEFTITEEGVITW